MKTSPGNAGSSDFFPNEFVVAAVSFKKKHNHNHHRCFFFGGAVKKTRSFPKKNSPPSISRGVQIRLTGFHKHIAGTFRRIARSSPLAWSTCNRTTEPTRKKSPVFVVFLKKTTPFFGWVGFFLGGGPKRLWECQTNPKKKTPKKQKCFFCPLLLARTWKCWRKTPTPKTPTLLCALPRHGLPSAKATLKITAVGCCQRNSTSTSMCTKIATNVA